MNERKIVAEATDAQVLQHLHEQCVAELRDDPQLTAAEKQELLRQLAVPDDQWEPTALPPGVESISETIIKLRRKQSL